MVETLALAALSAGLSYIALQLAKPKSSSPLQDQAPATLSERGRYTAVVSGRRECGPLIGWVGRRYSKKEKTGSSGGGSGLFSGPTPKQTVWFEDAWHQLTVGPVARLWAIRESGKVIFRGPIDQQSHPSGSVVDLGKNGRFYIWWGENDQDLNGKLNTRISINSRWPGLCSVYWEDKRLGLAPQWGTMLYEVERRPFGGTLSLSPSWFEPTKTASGTTYAVVSATDGGPGEAEIVVAGNRTTTIKPGGFVILDGNAAPDGDYEVFNATYDSGTAQTTVTLSMPLSGSDSAGTIEPYVLNQDDGANPAHLIEELLFAPAPRGAGRSRSRYYIPSLEALGQLCYEEGLASNALFQNGETVQAAVGLIMQDIGCMLSLNDAGLLEFRPIRPIDDTGTLLLIGDSVGLSPEPEIRNPIRATRQIDTPTYLFSDRERNYRPNEVAVHDDTVADVHSRSKVARVSLTIPTFLDVASKVAQRRALEEKGHKSQFRVYANREARRIGPGEQFVKSGLSLPLVVDTRRCSFADDKVELGSFVDFYGVSQATYTVPQGGGQEPDVGEVEADLVVAIVEVPAHVLAEVAAPAPTIVVPRVRANESVVGAAIHLSGDDVTYSLAVIETTHHGGGVLLDGLPASGQFGLDQGPTFTALGPDLLDVVADLSGDLTNWRLGRTWAYFPNTGEIAFVQKVTALGGTTYRMDGLLRARYGTRRGASSAGEPVLFFNRIADVENINDPLISPGATIYVKSQPETDESLPLDEIDAVSASIIGRGVVPMRPNNLRVVGRNIASYKTGGDVPLTWNWKSTATQKTGAGLQGYGEPTGQSAIQGSFLMSIRSVVDSLIAERAVAAPPWTYTNAMILADFGSEPSSFKIEVQNVNGGYRSPNSPRVELVITKT